MKRLFYAFLLVALLQTSLFAQTTPRSNLTKSRANAAAHGTFDATAISMIMWGTGMAVVFAAAAILIPKSTGATLHNHSH